MPEGLAETVVDFPARDYGNPDPEWLQVDWRRHLRRLQLPGAEVNYVELGEGEPIVFVHGLGGCWRNWLEQLPHFGRTHRAIAVDLPGFGHSPMPSWPIDMPAYGQLIHDFCEKLGIERGAALVGNSMGGFVATEAAIEGPRRFDRIVLVSAAGIGFARAVGSAVAHSSLRSFEAAMTVLSRPHSAFYRRPRGRQLAFGRLVRYPNLLRAELLRELFDPGLRAPGFAPAIRAIGGYDTRHRLQEIEVPTLVVWGLNDRIVRVEDAIGYHRLIPDSRLEIFERTGHVPQLERPGRFNSLVEDFLTA